MTEISIFFYTQHGITAELIKKSTLRRDLLLNMFYGYFKTLLSIVAPFIAIFSPVLLSGSTKAVICNLIANSSKNFMTLNFFYFAREDLIFEVILT